tara:strand:- start:196 stop:399 length:204 start_codon:yes stop_codon:yes gene_type:complete
MYTASEIAKMVVAYCGYDPVSNSGLVREVTRVIFGRYDRFAFEQVLDGTTINPDAVDCLLRIIPFTT